MNLSLFGTYIIISLAIGEIYAIRYIKAYYPKTDTTLLTKKEKWKAITNKGISMLIAWIVASVFAPLCLVEWLVDYVKSKEVKKS
jgi:hypothetical protein